MLTRELKLQLLTTAKKSIHHGLTHDEALSVNISEYPQELQKKFATFVTLHLNGQLRGCIGSLEAELPLIQDVSEHAFMAAFRDPRFESVTNSEYDQLEISISILSPSSPLQFNSESDLLRQLKPGIHGVILTEGPRRATFLPAVWENLPEKTGFLKQLKLKAGLPENYWSDSIQVKVYTVETIP